MASRIDHAKTAVEKDREAMTRRGFWASWRWQRSAQVHATLALAAEQKRVADWLEAWPLANDESPVVSVNGVS